MNSKTINPWTWQDNFGYAQAIEITHQQGTLYCSGQAAINADGSPAGGTMAEQITLSLQNLEQVIHQAGYLPANIVRLTIYTTSIAQFFAAYGTFVSWFQHHQFTPSSTLVQVMALAYPELAVEIDATVVR